MAFDWFNFDPIVDTVSGAFEWLGDNPEVAGGIAGAAGAGLGYLQNRENIKAQERARQEERDYREQFGGASSVDPGLYGQNLQIASPQQGIASPVGTPRPTMASALDLRTQREDVTRF